MNHVTLVFNCVIPAPGVYTNFIHPTSPIKILWVNLFKMKDKTDPGYWNELKIKLKKKYPQLQPSDFQHRNGEEESMLRIIEYKLRRSKEEMRKIIEGL